MVSIFEQIGEYTVRGASLSSGCCFDCRRPHRSMCKKLRLARLSLVGLYCQLPCESNNRRGGRKGEKQEAKEIIQSTRTQRNYGAEVGNRVEQSITVQN
jgi:hypothetical protein